MAGIEQIEEESKLQPTIAEAKDLIFMITARLDETQNIREKMEIKLGYATIRLRNDENSHAVDHEISNNNEEENEQNSVQTDSSNSQQNMGDNTSSTKQRSIKPPQASLPKFFGNPEEFQEYWAIFEALVHNSKELDTMEKILLLKESLKGRAQTAIKGIKLIPENYNWIIETLQENYCNQPSNRSQIVQKLVNLKAANETADSCSMIFDEIKMLTNQMVSAGYDVRKTCDPMWSETILSKFPQDIVRSVLIAGQTLERQTIDDLIGTLKKEITAKSYVENRLGQKHSNKVTVSSNSEIALYWTKSSKKLPIFVRNQQERIKTIKQQLETNGVTVNFFHVDTSHNPADAGTRGLTAQQIKDHDWVRGPRWLENLSNSSPLRSIETLTNVIDTEEADIIISTTIDALNNEIHDNLIDLTRFSKFDTVLRVIAIIGKTVHNWVSRINTKRSRPIQLKGAGKFDSKPGTSADDIIAAEQILFWNVHKNIDLSTVQKRFRDKKIIRDDKGIIRHFSRLQNASIPYDAKSPIYVPEESELARLIVQKIHTSNGHCGKEHTFTIARERFWITHPSKVFKKFLKNCTICKKYQGLPFGAPTMPPLPKDRVHATRPFENVGCDFMGPFTSNILEKMYVCLYTCLATRAVHLEVVENLSAGAFLNCFVRFISRRGVPKIVRSDCGTNFKLGETIIENMFEKTNENNQSLMSYCASERIKWIFNPPGSPWMGGTWERLVGLTKKAFHKSIGRKRLSFADMCTAITRIEAIINTRPLTKLNSSDIEDIPLRPIDFLKGNFQFSLPNEQVLDVSDDPNYDPNFIHTEKQAIEAYEVSETVSNKFWEKWSKEYLYSLRESQKINLRQPRHLSRSNPEVGEIVLIEEELIPRGSWSYGKITQVVVSNDGLVRSAKILLPNRRIIQRPLNKLFPLEIRSLANQTAPIATIAQDQSHKKATDENSSKKELPARAAKTRAYEIIKEFESGLEEPHSPTSSKQWSYPLIFVAFLSLLSSTSAQEVIPHVECSSGKISIISSNTSFRVCFDNNCRKIDNAQQNLSYILPISPMNDRVKVAVQYHNSGNKTIEKLCERPDFCKYNHILSKNLLGNPHCWPEGAIITTAVLLYIIATVLLIAIYSVLKCKRKNTRDTLEEVQMNELERTRNKNTQMFVPAPLPFTKILAVGVLISLVIKNADACQHGYTRHTANLICNEKNVCFYEYNQELLFNRLIKEICIEITHSNKTIGFIKVIRKPIELTCAKTVEFYTKDTRVRVYHVERCAQAGSCSDKKCHRMAANETGPKMLLLTQEELAVWPMHQNM
ncbi:integrase core domain protein [Oesophagostomum dentatum]|uniref:Integrase core domain protein n=1 Tax=Oesophagostomum dentatum TaxID=61180 RepID=A0A0B1TC92_OESDE|nr:integrase core domain protein [Oesophagostomum dentatum]